MFFLIATRLLLVTCVMFSVCVYFVQVDFEIEKELKVFQLKTKYAQSFKMKYYQSLLSLCFTNNK